MANETYVKFKRGLQTNVLNTTAVPYEDGTFYLTSDTGRLYVDINQGSAALPKMNRLLLNQTVQLVASLADLKEMSNGWTLTEKDNHKNDFYYITDSNILCVFTNTGTDGGWTQINPDTNTTIDSVLFTHTDSTNASTINLTLTDNKGSHTTATFKVSTAGGLTLSNDTNTNALVFTAPEYQLSRSAVPGDASQANIDLTSPGNNSLNSSLRLKGSDNVTFDTTISGTLGINVVDRQLDTVTLTKPTDGSIALTITDKRGHSVTSTLSNLGIILENGTYAPLGNTENRSAGAIYSKAQIDSLLSGIDGMRFMGTVSSGASLPTSGVCIGDTYVITSSSLSIANSFPGVTFDTSTLIAKGNEIYEFPNDHTTIGDMLIANSTTSSKPRENGPVVDGHSTLAASELIWVYIPSGNETLDTFNYIANNTTSNNIFGISRQSGGIVNQLTLTPGTNISISSTSNTDGMITTISHASINTTTAIAATTAHHVASFTAVKAITVDNGHITNIETDIFTPQTYTLTNANTSVTNTSGVKAHIDLKDEGGASYGAGSDLFFASNSLSLSTTSQNGVAINMVWGTF